LGDRVACSTQSRGVGEHLGLEREPYRRSAPRRGSSGSRPRRMTWWIGVRRPPSWPEWRDLR